jgi:2-polyprenyl-3-methyl-5-hydroxy-6-metoxy-1,4-benzoquinol methylase
MADNSVTSYYDAAAEKYHVQYQRDSLSNLAVGYPANYFRLQLLINSFVESGVKRVIEVGVGEGTPLSTIAKAGIEVAGFDISPAMVARSKAAVTAIGQDPEQIIWGDVEDPNSYVSLLRDGPFDALMAMGVMPHVQKDAFCLNNMRTMVKPGGKVFIEFRNKLFSLFTFNRYTHDFIMDDLLDGVAPAMKDIVSRDLKKRVEMDKPTVRSAHADDAKAPGYDMILSKFHNPLTVPDLFRNGGFEDIKLRWYHYHPAMPFLEAEDKALFRNESLRLEHDDSGWRGLFLCSAFVIEARKTAA